MQRSPKDIAVVGASTDMFSNPEQIKTIQILSSSPTSRVVLLLAGSEATIEKARPVFPKDHTQSKNRGIQICS
jgi:hypothetical protein